MLAACDAVGVTLCVSVGVPLGLLERVCDDVGATLPEEVGDGVATTVEVAGCVPDCVLLMVAVCEDDSVCEELAAWLGLTLGVWVGVGVTVNTVELVGDAVFDDVTVGA